jgi:putative FmdB family regulatory protein
MPTYTYRCSSCGVQFDKFQKFSDKPLTRCPECRTGTVNRIPQSSAIVFKGSGWYATDHRSPSGQTSRKSEGESASSDSATEKGEKSKKAKADKADD